MSRWWHTKKAREEADKYCDSIAWFHHKVAHSPEDLKHIGNAAYFGFLFGWLSAKEDSRKKPKRKPKRKRGEG